MQTIFSTLFGSWIYGTNTPLSDRDYKAIFIPNARDILLQRAPKTINHSTKVDKAGKNSPSDIDTEHFALHQYLKLLMEGQTVALDMLFTPSTFYNESSGEAWHHIQQHKSRFLHKGTTAFVGYAHQQAAKYGIKGSRIAALRAVISFMETYPTDERLGGIFSTDMPDGRPACISNDHTDIVMINGPAGTPEPHLEVCGRKIPFHATVKYTKAIFQKILDDYGHRALLAEKNQGVDWKALMHAVRVCGQAKELLSTGHITLPRPEKDLLLQIRKGELPYKQVSELIETGLSDLKDAQGKSSLRESPDFKFADSLIEYVYYKHVRQHGD